MPSDLDANPRNADWIKVVGRAREFGRWTAERIDKECASAYRRYHREVRDRHVAFYAAHPELCNPSHTFVAASRECAFPPGQARLANALGESSWHKHHLSAGSSQVLAIALLAAAAKADPSLAWLPGWERLGDSVLPLFEVELDARVLNERPRQTSLDWLVLGSGGVVAAEAKFTERGFGMCSCESRPTCSPRVLERPYWEVGGRELGLRRERENCALSVAYQPVRNVAAAAALAGERRAAAFVLLYDDRNPYFAGAGEWPGWVAILHGVMRHGTVAFESLSWQQLLHRAPIDDAVSAWADEKHGLA